MRILGSLETSMSLHILLTSMSSCSVMAQNTNFNSNYYPNIMKHTRGLGLQMCIHHAQTPLCGLHYHRIRLHLPVLRWFLDPTTAQPTKRTVNNKTQGHICLKGRKPRSIFSRPFSCNDETMRKEALTDKFSRIFSKARNDLKIQN